MQLHLSDLPDNLDDSTAACHVTFDPSWLGIRSEMSNSLTSGGFFLFLFSRQPLESAPSDGGGSGGVFPVTPQRRHVGADSE